VLIIVAGSGWLMNVLGIIPKVDWIWTFVLAVVGILTMAVGGVDRVTFVIGPFLITSSILSILRQTGGLSIEKETPILIILLGLLSLISCIFKLPVPKALQDDSDEK
jgi:hypothetical protein